MVILYHATSPEAADAILREGFRDYKGTYGLEGFELRGVFLSNMRLGENDGTKGDTILVVELCAAETEIADLELVEVGKSHREWCIPAAFIKARGKVRRPTVEEENEWSAFVPP